MNVDKKTAYGKIDISLDAISQVAANALVNVFGVVGLGSCHSSLSGNINKLLNKESFREGVTAKKEKDKYSINLYIIVSYGVKVSEVIAEVQTQVGYYLSKAFDIKFDTVNVFVQGVKKM